MHYEGILLVCCTVLYIGTSVSGWWVIGDNVLFVTYLRFVLKIFQQIIKPNSIQYDLQQLQSVLIWSMPIVNLSNLSYANPIN